MIDSSESFRRLYIRPADMPEQADDLPFADCVLVSSSGRTFPSWKGILSVKSPVFRDLVASCLTEPDSSEGRNLPDVPLRDHTDKEEDFLWRQLHGVDPVIRYVSFCGTQEGNVVQRVRDVILLTEIAHKFDVKGGVPGSKNLVVLDDVAVFFD